MVSIIIPTYNNERFIGACVDSVLSQRGVELDIIVIDDGSTDTTGAIVDDYATRHASIRVVHRANGGLSAARNTAIPMIRGEWVTMLDGDDMLSPNAIKRMLDAANSYKDIDIVAGRWFTDFVDIPIHNPSSRSRMTTILSGKEAAETMLYCNRYRDAVHSSACGKLYRSELWRDARFREGIVYEDLQLIPQLTAAVSNVAVIDDIIYYYRRNPESIIHTFSLRRYDAVRVAKELVDHFTNDRQLVAAARSRLFSAAFNLLLLMRANDADMPHQRAECRHIIKSLAMSQTFGRKVRFKNRMGGIVAICPWLFRSKYICKKLLAK